MSDPTPQDWREPRKLQEIKGSIAEALRERFEKISAAVKELNDHLASCAQCQAKEPPYKLCGTGYRLFNAAMSA